MFRSSDSSVSRYGKLYLAFICILDTSRSSRKATSRSSAWIGLTNKDRLQIRLHSAPTPRVHGCSHPTLGQRNGCSARKHVVTSALFQDRPHVGANSLIDIVKGRALRSARYSTEAQITPPAFAMKSGTTSTPRSCSARSASGVHMAPCGIKRVRSRETLSARTTSGRAAGIHMSQSMSRITSAASFEPL